MASHDGPLDEASRASAEPATLTPAMPSVPDQDLYSGPPYLLADDAGIRHSIGWQDDRRAGPGFVVARKRSTGRAKIIERFPLTEEGWASAWQALADVDETKMSRPSRSAGRVRAAHLARRQPSASFLACSAPSSDSWFSACSASSSALCFSAWSAP